MKKDDLKNLTQELLNFSVADTPVQDVLLKLSTRSSAATLAGFSVCAGYLLATLQQLRSEKPMTQEDITMWYRLGSQEVLETYQHLLGSCSCGNSEQPQT